MERRNHGSEKEREQECPLNSIEIFTGKCDFEPKVEEAQKNQKDGRIKERGRTPTTLPLGFCGPRLICDVSLQEIGQAEFPRNPLTLPPGKGPLRPQPADGRALLKMKGCVASAKKPNVDRYGRAEERGHVGRRQLAKFSLAIYIRPSGGVCRTRK